MEAIKLIRDMPAGQRLAGRALVGFFSLMLAFTVISRGLSSFTVARVTAAAPSYGALTHEIKLDGSAEPSGETAASLPEGFLIKQLMIREGSMVDPGDAVALLDIPYIEKKLETARRELSDAELTHAAGNARGAVFSGDDSGKEKLENLWDEARLKYNRAKEDAESLEKSAGQAVARAADELWQARQERRELVESRDEGGIYYDEAVADAELTAIDKDIDAKVWALKEAELARDKALTDGKRGIEDARRGIDSTRLEIEEAVREDSEQKQKALSEAEANRLEGGRGELVITEKRERVAALEALLEQEGRVAAMEGGVVTAVTVKAGDITQGGGAYLLAGQNDCVFTAPATKKEADRLVQGDGVEIALTGLREVIQTEITAIEAPKEPGGAYSVIVAFKNQSGISNAKGTLKAVKRGSGESAMLPLTALYSDGGESRGYVFALREKQTTMGAQTVVERIDVEILDRGSRMAAIDAAFAPDDKIVTSSSRVLGEGDRVRLESAA